MPDTALRLKLDGMTCASCVARAERVLAAQPGVTRASVNLGTESADVVFDAPATLAGLTGALGRAGYPARLADIELSVEGMTCGSCTARVERVLAAQPGVLAATANLATRSARVTALAGTEAQALAQAVSRAGYDAAPKADVPPPGPSEQDRLWRDTAIAAALTLPVFVVEMGGHLIPAFHHWLMARVPMDWLWRAEFLLAALVLAGPGRRFFAKGIPALLRGAPEMNALVAIGTAAAFLYSTVATFLPGLLPAAQRSVYFEASVVIVTLILLGRALEARARGRAGAAIARLVALQPKTALVEGADGTLTEMPISALAPGARVHIRPGERIPTDGLVLRGTSAVDCAMLTGEPLPVEKSPGAGLNAGTVNGQGALVMEVTALGRDTVLARIIALVEQAQGSKLPVQAVIDRVTLWFVPVVMGLAALTVAVWLLAGQGAVGALVAGVSVLIIACPCAMGLATPVSILVGTGRAAELGILFRRGEGLQRLAGAQVVAFDKTGTLTEGHPRVTSVVPESALPLAASLAQGSDHPLSAAISRAAEGLTLPPASDHRAVPGMGVVAQVAGQTLHLGAARFFAEVPAELAAVAAEAAGRGDSVVFVGPPERAQGVIAASDQLKPGAAPAIAALHAAGLRVALISGDSQAAARRIGARLGIDLVVAEVTPEGKRDEIARLGPGVVFVGDGINDAPALAAAEVGIAMGGGTDVAIEAGEVVLMRGDPMGVPQAIGLSRAVMRNIRQNLIWAFGYNAALIPVAAGALVPFGGPQLSPMLAAGAMGLSSVFVLTNALRLRLFRA